MLIGVALILRALVRSGLPIGSIRARKIALVLGAIVLFGLLLRGLGLIIAIIVIVVLSAYASENFRWLSALGPGRRDRHRLCDHICPSFWEFRFRSSELIGTWIGD